MIYFYGVCCLLGLILPLTQLLPWLIEQGLNIPLFIKQAAQLRIGAFAWLDVIVSAIALTGFIVYEGARIKMKRVWLPVAATFMVGVSLGLPLFLLLREHHLDKKPG